MKKFLALFLVLALMVSLVACGSGEEPVKENVQPDAPKSEAAEIVPVVKERDLPEGDYTELGDGTAYVATPGGTSEDGNIPVIYVGDEILMQIGLNTSEFNGGALSFIYIDGMVVGKEQLADSQATLTLQQEQLAEGIHTVEVVQYTNDEPGSEMITYKSMQYQVKKK